MRLHTNILLLDSNSSIFHYKGNPNHAWYFSEKFQVNIILLKNKVTNSTHSSPGVSICNSSFIYIGEFPFTLFYTLWTRIQIQYICACIHIYTCIYSACRVSLHTFKDVQINKSKKGPHNCFQMKINCKTYLKFSSCEWCVGSS